MIGVDAESWIEHWYDLSGKKTTQAAPGRLRCQTVKKAKGFFDKGLAACRSAGTVRHGRTVPTFAGRDVFSPTYMPPEKMISFYFAAAAAKLYEVFDKLKRGSGKCRFRVCFLFLLFLFCNLTFIHFKCSI